MVTSLALKYSAPVPRYTSYPTAPHFVPLEGQDLYTDWLSELDPSNPVSLYFHVPYCKKMCWYCGCHTKITRKYDPVGEYAAAMKKELETLASYLPGRFKVSHVHWGGGTPSILNEDDFKSIMGTVATHFDYVENAERAIEIDPRTVDTDKIIALAEAGINRASLGVQDFNPIVQTAINRIQPFDMTKKVVDDLRDHGITSINFDLMYGLPHQTTDDVRRTIDLSHEMKPDRIALFGYAHVPWMKSHMKLIHEEYLPDTEARVEQAMVASEYLKELGYRQIGLDHFASPEDEMSKALESQDLKRNFQGYTTDNAEALLGIGASSIGMMPQGYVQNVVSIPEYLRLANAGKLAIAKGIEVSEDDIIRREIIERLMCDLAVDLSEIEKKFGLSKGFFGQELARLQDFAEDGLLELHGKQIKVNEDGRFLVRTICAVFDTYLGKGIGKHSRAV